MESIDKLRSIIILLVCVLIGCTSNRPQVIVITSTFLPESSQPITLDSTIVETTPFPVVESTPNPIASSNVVPDQYIVQPGDTLSGIAVNYNTSLQSLLSVNNIQNPDLLEVGQVLIFPESPNSFTPVSKLLPDARLVNSPLAINFEIDTFLSSLSGFIRIATDAVSTRLADGSEIQEVLTATEIVERVSLEYSIDPACFIGILGISCRLVISIRYI